ncbi:hypothetical protein BDZ94DRAFT_1152647 [Collybia nuda]|uniref:Uncharacterized protein n=1 Tax=Collybia nuda TaxID=64659 RepID=A0A9P5YGJ4_9AGAR|nr:hypothetical protein BDZ94DRAFT_1152647 [Collybia nuda]
MTTAKPLDSSRRDTDHYLQYYQSSLADGVKSDGGDGEASRSPRLRRQMSGGSTSPSDYSSDERETRRMKESDSAVRRRPSLPSDGGSDRRRLAIVQMEAVAEGTSQPSAEKLRESGSIRSRRGLASNLAGLALVAPPDAAVKSYTQLTPPSTAPITGETSYTRDAPSSISHSERGHSRSASEVVDSKKKSPRDVGIVGTGRNSPIINLPKQFNIAKDRGTVLQPPIFQQPVSRSPSPNAASVASDHAHDFLSPIQARPPLNRRSTEQLIVTPEIGEEKAVDTRVAGPVVVSLESTKSLQVRKTSRKASPTPQIMMQQVPVAAFPVTGTSSYLNYQPGVHATAGPLPPPPRAMFNIDTNSPAPPRPPRLNSPNPIRPRGDIEAVKQALQLPPSVSAALASRSPKPMPSKILNASQTDVSSKNDPEADKKANSELNRVKSVHRREGAFSPSTITTTSELNAAVSLNSPTFTEPDENMNKSDPIAVGATPPSASEVINYDDGPPITIIKPLKSIVEKQSSEDATDNAEADGFFLVPTTPERRRSDELSNGSRSQSPPPSSHTGETPSPPPKSFRNSLTNGLKRFSTLPRTPSIKSSRRSSGGTHYSSRTPSPSMMQTSLPTPRQKIKSQYPSAMFCSEIFSRKTALERCAVYAHKINELYMYDCGLEDWIIETKYRANTNRPTFSSVPHTFTPQPRHTSRASMISEVTFPRRLDASTATDLSVKTRDLVPTSPPPLPYPSLAQNQRMFPTRSSSVASGTPPSSIRSLAPSTPVTKTGGFFASLGRKASLTSARGARPGGSPASSPGGGRLTKNPPTIPSPRVINIPTNPSVPGGPRAPPHRALRSQTIMTTTNPFVSSSPTSERGDSLARRPSLSNMTQEPVIDIHADPEFVRQVDKLVDLLPHADRSVLAGYLRRAGQDILAIGQYLEDEKNGTIRY